MPTIDHAKIDRKALVSRHNVVLTQFNGDAPLQVGNGEFAFGMDITGLQTFVPFNTMSHWGWHSGVAPQGQSIADFEGQIWETHGRPVRYNMPDPARPELSEWLASSPHRINLGRLGLVLTKRDGSEASVTDLQSPKQVLDLWTGIVKSTFSIEGEQVTVITAAHPKKDRVAFQIESRLMEEGRLSVFVSFPGSNPLYMANFVGDWSSPGQFDSVAKPGVNQVDLYRKLDATSYFVGLKWKGQASLIPPSDSGTPLTIVEAKYGANSQWADVTDQATKAIEHGRLKLHVGGNLGPDPAPGIFKELRFTYRVGNQTRTIITKENDDLFLDSDPGRSRYCLKPSSRSFSFSATFSPTALPESLPDPSETLKASQLAWPSFWKSGGAIDLSESADPRWRELERRIVLSQYLMAVNEAGSYPPAESGLVNNSWYGRFHLEMVWWHAAHWALWNRWDKVNPSLDIYRKILPQAKALAASQGYSGARWPKCIGPNGTEWPHEIHALLIWQQPHPIFFAELDYRAHPTKATLEKWLPIVDATADFLASYAFLEKATGKYVLGPPLYVVSENVDPHIAKNPAFELGYWRFGLRTAIEWRKRLSMPRQKQWETVLSQLAPIPTQAGEYVLYEGVKDMWTRFNYEHPALIGTFGMLPGDGVDKSTMERTLRKISAVWQLNRTWGWDFPMLAMCAARLGHPDQAVEFLLNPAQGFQFDERGLATGGPFPYFPSNGGLLYAVAMLAAGWDGAPNVEAPGFPKNGRWKVRSEGFRTAL